MKDVSHLFPEVKYEDIQRPIGMVDMLIGWNYAYLHPTNLRTDGNLRLMSSKFGTGYCVDGSHKDVAGSRITLNPRVNFIKNAKIGERPDEFKAPPKIFPIKKNAQVHDLQEADSEIVRE